MFFDAIGWFTDEELVETVEVRFMVVGFDFAAILSLTFVDCQPGTFSGFSNSFSTAVFASGVFFA